jgi:hypothetical protein
VGKNSRVTACLLQIDGRIPRDIKLLLTDLGERRLLASRRRSSSCWFASGEGKTVRG